jgi:DNA-binding Lrp family transcriptional regulator
MIKIDLKDRKILYELDLDARQSLTEVGKKVGLKKDVVSYRIKRMQDEGIIKNFWTSINTFKLGYDVFRIYISFRYVNQEKKNEIIQHFVNCKKAWAVITATGEVDLDVVLWVNDNYEFYQFWMNTLDRYEEYFARSTISLYIQAICYKKTYLLLNYVDTSNRFLYETTCSGNTVVIDEADYDILNELAVNARIPLIELAEKLDCSSQKIDYRIKNLMKSGVIQAFRVNLDHSQFGFQLYKIDMYLKEHKQREPIMKYLSKNPYLECMNIAVGWADLEPEFIVENTDHLIQIMEDVESMFPHVIHKQTYWATEAVHKERWLPEKEF